MQEKPVYTCSLLQGSLKFGIKAVNKDPRQHNAWSDMIREEFASCSYNASSAAEEPVGHVAVGWVCDASCLPRVDFPFYVKWRTRTFKWPGVRFALRFLSQISVKSFPLHNADRNLTFYTPFLIFRIISLLLIPSSLSCNKVNQHFAP